MVFICFLYADVRTLMEILIGLAVKFHFERSVPTNEKIMSFSFRDPAKKNWIFSVL